MMEVSNEDNNNKTSSTNGKAKLRSSYPEYKEMALSSIKKHLVQHKHEHYNYNQLVHHCHIAPHSYHSHSYDHEDEEEESALAAASTIDYDISKLFLSFDDFNCVLNYWEYRFNDVDLVVGIEPSGLVLGSVFSQRLRLPFLMLKKKSCSGNSSLTSSTDGATGLNSNSSTSDSDTLREEFGSDDEELEVESNILPKLLSSAKLASNKYSSPSLNSLVSNTNSSNLKSNENKKFHILIMDDLLENGNVLAASIELVKKLMAKKSDIKEYKISTTFISSIKSLQGKEKIYSMYNDINVDVINIIE